MKRVLVVCMLFSMLWRTSFAQSISSPTELPDHPFEIRKTWMVGGEGNWDFIRLDPGSHNLFIAHGHDIQVVDSETGMGQSPLSRFRDVHDIAFDDQNEFGFISDAAENGVRYAGGIATVAGGVTVFDRRTMRPEAVMPTAANPRAVVYEPQSKLLFVICGQPNEHLPAGFAQLPELTRLAYEKWLVATDQFLSSPGAYTAPKASTTHLAVHRSARYRPADPPPSSTTPVDSVISVFDAESWTPLTNILVHGRAGFAKVDGDGQVYINIVDESRILRLDGPAVKEKLDELVPVKQRDLKDGRNQWAAIQPGTRIPKWQEDQADGLTRMLRNTLAWDWSEKSEETQPPREMMQTFSATICHNPQGLALDSQHSRLFVACADQKLSVINTITGKLVTTVPTGFGTGMVDYDSQRGLIFVANGDLGGTLTVIRQDVNDSYSVWQNLPTCYRARALAVNPANGDVYMASDAGQANPDDAVGIQGARLRGVKGSMFHVLVAGQ
jgi:hypothetical protein